MILFHASVLEIVHRKEKMNNYVSFLLEAGAAEMRLARLFNQKNSTRQTIDRRGLPRGTPVVQLGQIPNNTANCFEKIVTSTNLLTPKEEQRHRRGSHPK
jgi:hypothetical protein